MLAQLRKELGGVLSIHLTEMAQKLLNVTEALVGADEALEARVNRVERTLDLFFEKDAEVHEAGQRAYRFWDAPEGPEEPTATQPYKKTPVGAVSPRRRRWWERFNPRSRAR